MLASEVSVHNSRTNHGARRLVTDLAVLDGFEGHNSELSITSLKSVGAHCGSGQPSLHRRDLAIRKQRHDLSPLQIADNRAGTPDLNSKPAFALATY
jgi:hypothetical protein